SRTGASRGSAGAAVPSPHPAPAAFLTTADAAPDLRRRAACRRRHRQRSGSGRQRAILLAPRPRTRQVPLAGERASDWRKLGKFIFLRELGHSGLLLLRRARAHGLPHAGAAAGVGVRRVWGRTVLGCRWVRLRLDPQDAGVRPNSKAWPA